MRGPGTGGRGSWGAMAAQVCGSILHTARPTPGPCVTHQITRYAQLAGEPGERARAVWANQGALGIFEFAASYPQPPRPLCNHRAARPKSTRRPGGARIRGVLWYRSTSDRRLDRSYGPRFPGLITQNPITRQFVPRSPDEKKPRIARLNGALWRLRANRFVKTPSINRETPEQCAFRR